MGGITIKHYASVAGCFMRMAIQRQLEYPSFLVCWFIGIPIQYLCGVGMISTIAQRFQTLNGWTYQQIIFLYGLSLLSHGLMVVFFIPVWNIEGAVIRGDFDRLLLRPVNTIFHFCVQYFNFIGLVDMVPGVIIFLYGCGISRFAWTPGNIIKLILVLAGAVTIRAAFFTIMGCTAFWTKGSHSLVGVGQAMLERTTMYPLSIYPYLIQVLFSFVIPFGFVSFYPACDFFGKSEGMALPVGFALLTPVIGLIMACIAVLIFNKGLKKYESAGS